MNYFRNRDGYNKRVKTLIDRIGDDPIVKMTIHRAPVSNFMITILNGITFGDFKKRMRKEGYDKLFHLRVDLKLSSGKTVYMEKNDYVNLMMNPKKGRYGELRHIDVNGTHTIKSLLENARKQMGDDNFFRYSAYGSNCQDFLYNVMTASKLGTLNDLAFIKQKNTKLLFNSISRKLTNTITDISGKLSNDTILGGDMSDTEIDGEGVKAHAMHLKKVWSEMEDHFMDTFSKHFPMDLLKGKGLEDDIKKFAKKNARRAGHTAVDKIADAFGAGIEEDIKKFAKKNARRAGHTAVDKIADAFGAGVKKEGKFVKGSAEAKEWGRKMAEARKAKKGSSSTPKKKGIDTGNTVIPALLDKFYPNLKNTGKTNLASKSQVKKAMNKKQSKPKTREQEAFEEWWNSLGE